MKKMQIELPEMKTTISEMENMLGAINSRLDIVEEKMSELEGLATKTIPNETCRAKRIQKN